MLENIDLQQVLVLDIETVPQYPSFDELPADFQELWEQKTKFQRKDGETPAEFYARGGILAEFGKVICISVGIFSNKTKDLSLRVKSFYGDEEKEVLQSFIDLLKTLAIFLTGSLGGVLAGNGLKSKPKTPIDTPIDKRES